MAEKAKRQISYREAHNRAVRMYQRCCTFLLWAGVVCVFAALIGVIQIAANTVSESVSYPWPTSGFALTFSINILLSSLVLKSMASVWASLLIMLISIIIGALFALAGVWSMRGRVVLLFVGMGIYALDFGAMFFVYKFFAPFVWTNYAFTLVIHVVVLAALVMAVIQFYNVFHIEKVFKGDDKAEMKEEVESEVIASGKQDINS